MSDELACEQMPPPPDNVRAGIIGLGHFSTAILAQSTRAQGLSVAAVADVDVESAMEACRQAEVGEGDAVVCRDRASAVEVIDAGKLAVLEDAGLLMDLPLTVLVEATGNAEAGANYVTQAISHGKNVALVNKEVDSVIGPLLRGLARRQGLVCTSVDGDQHGLLMALVKWARLLGLEIICGGKARDSEYVYDPVQSTVSCDRAEVKVPHHLRWAMAPIVPGQVKECLAARKEALSSLPQAAGFDLCEMAIAANGTGLLPDVPRLHCPALRTSEIPEVMTHASDGGILEHTGAIDVVTCLRQKHEAGLGGGVFIVVRSARTYPQRMLVDKGCLANHSGQAALIYRPYHLCGVETIRTIVRAGLGRGTDSDDFIPRLDLTARAAVDLPAGAVLGGDHSPDLQAAMVPACPIECAKALPLHLFSGLRLRRSVAAGDWISPDAVETPMGSTLWALRRQQDKQFFDERRPSP
jgi:predicted homoserine dehydrogenase-like protein